MPGESVWSSSDFTYLGAYQQPDETASYARWRIAFRRVGGQRRLLVNDSSNTLLREYSIVPEPVSSTTEGSLPAPSLVTSFDTFVGAKMPGDLSEGVDPPRVWGIHWDEEGGRLYWCSGSSYVTAAVPASYPHYGYCTLSGSTCTPHGPWGLTSGQPRGFMGGPCTLPQSFADAYTSGRRLGLGWGGYYSINQAAIAGLALAAADPPDPADVDEGGTYPHTVLAKYGTFIDPNGLHRAPRSANYANLTETGASFQPSGGAGRWTNDGIIQGSACWIDSPSGKSGVVAFVVEGEGDIQYHQDGYFASAGSRHWWHSWSAEDLGAVTLGADPYALDSTRWDVTYPLADYDLGPGLFTANFGTTHTGPDNMKIPRGACYDPVESRLYLFLPQLFDGKRGAVLVYEVA